MELNRNPEKRIMKNDTQVADKAPRSGVFVSLPPEQHKALKIQAIESGQTLQVYVSRLLQNAFANRGGEVGAAPRGDGRRRRSTLPN